MCKLIKRMVHHRLTCLLEEHCILPDKRTGFRKSRGTAITLTDLCWTLEDAKVKHKMAHRVFLDVCHTFHTLPQATIIHQLRLNGVQGRLFAF